MQLNKTKQLIISVLNADNQLLNESKTEIADNKFGITKGDQNLTNQFYNSQK
jgi:hypothetical protein